MGTTVKTIIPAGGGDYTTVAAWIAGWPANFVTDGNIQQGQLTGTLTVTSGVVGTFAGSTVDSTHYAELTTAAGQSFRDNANVQTNALKYNASNGAAITTNVGYTRLFFVQIDFCRFSNLQIQHSSTVGGALFEQDAAYTLDINNCIWDSANAAVIIAGSNAKMRNSLAVMRGNSKPRIVTLTSGASLYNCTLAVPSDVTWTTSIFDANYGTPEVKNCALFGNGAALRGGSATPTYTTCYTDASSPPSGVTAATYDTTQFVDITDATRDYRIPTGSVLKDTGTTDATNAVTDIAGSSRPQGAAYDVGCWEYAVVGGADPLMGQACL